VWGFACEEAADDRTSSECEVGSETFDEIVVAVKVHLESGNEGERFTRGTVGVEVGRGTSHVGREGCRKQDSFARSRVVVDIFDQIGLLVVVADGVVFVDGQLSSLLVVERFIFICFVDGDLRLMTDLLLKRLFADL
jgi:hypothetical protein